MGVAAAVISAISKIGGAQNESPSPVPRRIRRLPGVLHFGHIAPGIRLRAIEIGEAVDPRQSAAGERLPGYFDMLTNMRGLIQ